MLRLFTLGSVDLEGPPVGDPGAVLAQPKRLALLIYLAAARPFGVHRRDELLALFWPDLDDTRARDALNQALRFLRQALGPDVFVRRGGEDVGIDQARFWCDAAAFHEALEAGRPAEALALYRGDFLQGFFIEEGGGFEEWMERERAAYREAAARGAREVAEREAEGGGYTQAIVWGRRALELAPDDERALRRLLRWYDRAGDRAGAFRQYEAFARRFQDAFAAEPSAETKRLVEALRAGQPLPEEAGSRRPPAGRVAPATDQFSERYRIERKLGAGGMATVFLATDLKHDREVALKVLKPEVAEGLARERFIREIRIAGRLQHPNIVPLFDSGEEKGQLFYVMPHVQGENLRERLRREGKLGLETVGHVLREVALGLAYAHHQGIVHRDIKPENILLIDRRAVLTDFGIARAAQAARTSSEFDPTLTQPGTSLGTPAYMAPEQASGKEDVDHRADLYSLGVVGYELLTGTTPFTGTSTYELLAAQLTRSPEPIRTLRPDVPAQLEALVLQCLEKLPEGRPQSARAFLEVLDHEGPVTRPVQRARVGRNPLASGFQKVVALMVLLAGGLLGGSLLWSRLNGVTEGALQPEEATQVAVRAFTDLSSGQELGYVAEGLTQEVVSELTRIPVLRVRAATAMIPFQRATPDSLRRALGIGTLIEGSVDADPDSLRVTATIVMTRTGDVLARERWVLARRGLLGSQDSLVSDIGRFVRDRLGDAIRVEQSRKATRDSKAWELYQLGSTTFQEAKRLYQRGEIRASDQFLRVADSLMRQAELEDPGWNDPVLARGWLQHWRAFQRPAPGPGTPADWLRSAIREADRVLARRPDHPEARELRGTGLLDLVISGVGDSSSLIQAEADLRRSAVPNNPTQARAWHMLSIAMRWRGRPAEANIAARRAYDLDAFQERSDRLLSQLCATSFELRQFADAERWCLEGRRRFPREFDFPYYLLQMLPFLGERPSRADSAWALYRDVQRTSPTGEWADRQTSIRMMVATVLAGVGLKDSARRVLLLARRSPHRDPDLDVYDAAVLTALGEREAAVDRLQAYLARFPLNRALVGEHPSFADLANDSRFQRLVAPAGRKPE